MVYCRNPTKFHPFAVSFLLFLNVITGRMLLPNDGSSKTVIDDKLLLRPQIGSRPPRCEGRCSYCMHCVAIQVPTNPQQSGRGTSKNGVVVGDALTNGFSGDDYHSNYKPMSWKCKCGSLIFNP